MAKAARKRAPRADSADEAWINPIEILKGWWSAILICTAAYFSPPFNLAGQSLPAPKKGEVGQAVRGLPVVGLAAGLVAGIVYAIAYIIGLPPLVSAILAIAVLVFLTGAVNEGEFARFADALIMGGSKTQQLAQLKEDALGAYGISVLVLCLALRVGIVAYIGDPFVALGALAAAATFSFAAVACALYALRPARRSGFAFNAGRASADQALIATLLAIAFMLLCLPPLIAVVGMVIGALGAVKFGWFAHRNLGGTTKAVLGAVQQGTEIGVLLAVAALI
ncbi:MAG TPA: adenosylcobinamide-GDP ribazoletransferase [Alphaproteobacteria bacterium]|nr:adenosylcobinamide-GDP ribazoletransferase [Alphaproteobacteria bacterium]